MNISFAYFFAGKTITIILAAKLFYDIEKRDNKISIPLRRLNGIIRSPLKKIFLMKIGIYSYKPESEDIDFYLDLYRCLNNSDIELFLFKPFYDFLKTALQAEPIYKNIFNDTHDLPNDLDVIFSIGGDGTVLETVSLVRDKEIPIAGINSGRLGFLANISKSQFEMAVKNIINKNFSTEKRALIALVNNDTIFKDFNCALNEITIHKKDTSSMVSIDAYVNDELLTTYWADGLIIATPTGSTAYSLSVGGPIVVPQSKNFIISPIAPHNLSMRPMILPDSVELKIKITSREDKSFLVSLDYRSEDYDGEIELIIRRAEYDIILVKLPDTSFFNTIRSKMMWGVDKRNRI